MHGGAAPRAREAAARRRAEAEATALLELLWDPEAHPVEDPIEALQRLAGQLQHSAGVLGARLDALSTTELDGPTGLAWVRILRELRQALEGMERLNLTAKQVQLEQDKAKMVGVAVLAAMDAVSMAEAQRATFTQVLMSRMRLVEAARPALPVVRGQVQS